MSVEIFTGNALDKLRDMPSESVDCVITSPPYWGLRDYGTARWIGGNPDCEHSIFENFVDDKRCTGRPTRGNRDCCLKCGAKRVDEQIGLEPTHGEHIAALLKVFEEIKRILKPEGTLWVNYGDCYATKKNGRSAKDIVSDDRKFTDKPFSTVCDGLKQKDLVGMPWRLAFALQENGWWLRQDIIWNKPNPMPESAKDRFVKSHEYLFLLTKSSKYFFDYKSVKEPAKCASTDKRVGKGRIVYDSDNDLAHRKFVHMTKYRNKRSVWNVPTKGFKEAHFATFSPNLIRPCVLAGCPKGGVVLDPFGGAGTTSIVAEQEQRNSILIELNPEYVELTKNRIFKECGLFTDIEIK